MLSVLESPSRYIFQKTGRKEGGKEGRKNGREGGRKGGTERERERKKEQDTCCKCSLSYPTSPESHTWTINGRWEESWMFELTWREVCRVCCKANSYWFVFLMRVSFIK